MYQIELSVLQDTFHDDYQLSRVLKTSLGFPEGVEAAEEGVSPASFEHVQIPQQHQNRKHRRTSNTIWKD